MNSKFILNGLVGLHGNLSLWLIVIKLCFELTIEWGGRHTTPFLTILSPKLIILVLLILKDLKHLLNHLKVVIADCAYPLYHALHVSMATLLLEVFDLFPKILRNFCCRCCCMVSLREAILLQEFLLVYLDLLLILEHLIDYLLQLSLKFYLHYSHLRWHYMS